MPGALRLKLASVQVDGVGAQNLEKPAGLAQGFQRLADVLGFRMAGDVEVEVVLPLTRARRGNTGLPACREGCVQAVYKKAERKLSSCSVYVRWEIAL